MSGPEDYTDPPEVTAHRRRLAENPIVEERLEEQMRLAASLQEEILRKLLD